MTKYNFDPSVVGEIVGSLDSYGLRQEQEHLVVVGGAVLASLGLKNWDHTDLDVVVDGALMDKLDVSPQFCSLNDGYSKPPHMFEGKYVREMEARSMPQVKDGRIVNPIQRFTVMEMPIDALYDVDSASLIDQGIRLGVTPKTPYLFLRPTAVLDWKTALVDSENFVNRDKHIADIKRLARYIGKLF